MIGEPVLKQVSHIEFYDCPQLIPSVIQGSDHQPVE